MADVGSSQGGGDAGGPDVAAAADAAEIAQPNPTSRISVRHAVEVIQTFDEYKRWLVGEIGFGGMLQMPMLQKLNLKFSAWIMGKVSVSQRAIILSEIKKLKFWPEDVHKVFGIPCGHRSIRGRDGNIKPEAIQFIKKTLGMDKKGVHSLRATEEFLLRDISETSSKLEKDCFQIAFVIFVMVHVLAPTTKHDYATIDFWGALASMEMISQFNWCEYVLDFLLEAVRRVKNDILSGNANTNLVGCHLFLQVFFLDNLDLGIFNKKHNVLLRISEFDQDSIRRMVTMSTDVGKKPTSHSNCKLRPAGDVCYARQNHPEEPPNPIEADGSASVQHCTEQPLAVEHARAPLAGTSVPMQSPVRMLGPIDFVQHLRARHPSMASDEITILLTEQNARIQRNINTSRANAQLDMFNFADKLFDALSKRCICCSIRGFSDCPARAIPMPEGTTIKTPAGQKISGVRLNMSSCEGDSSTSKRPARGGSTDQSSKRQRTEVDSAEHIKTSIVHLAQFTLRAVSELFIHLPNDGSTTVFGERREQLPGRKYVHRPGFQTDPWGRGVVPHPPSMDISELIIQLFASSSMQELSRNYLVHERPRFVRVTGVALKEQLGGETLIDHELMSVILRRFSQIDQHSDPECPYLSWRHPIEPDFSTLILAEYDYLHTVSIQNQLVAESQEYDLTSAELFYTPVPRPEGWMIVFFNMLTRVMSVIDPLYHKNMSSPPTHRRDETIAWKLHDALFNCLNEFYAGWPTSKENWTLKFPCMTDTIFSRDEMGGCVIHVARQFDGDKLKLPLAKIPHTPVSIGACSGRSSVQVVIKSMNGTSISAHLERDTRSEKMQGSQFQPHDSHHGLQQY